MTFWQLFFASLGGTATALVIAGFLGRTLIEQWFKKDFKRFEAKLDQIASAEQTKFAHRHEKQASIAAEAYADVVELNRQVDAYHLAELRVTIIKSVVEKSRAEESASKAHQQLQAALGALEKYIARNRLYLDDDISEQLDAFCKTVSRAAVSIGSLGMSIEDRDIEGEREMRRELNQILAALSEARKHIEGHFKRLLGVAPETAVDTSI
jgi:hypothetical protein